MNLANQFLFRLFKRGTSADEKELVIGCVTENTPKYLEQSLRLVQSIRWFGGKIADTRIIVCAVEQIDQVYQDKLQEYQVEIRIVDRFSEIHPQSNKLRFLQLEDITPYKKILLLDCDTIIVQDPFLFLETNSLKAKIADGPTVPHHIFVDLFKCFQIPLPERKYLCTIRDKATIAYCNAGVLLFSQTGLKQLVPTWVEINEKLIENIEILGEYKNFCEQASLSLSIEKTKIKLELFQNEMNLPIHHVDYISHLEHVDPKIIHYHNQVDNSGYIMKSQYTLANKRIEQFNRRLHESRQTYL